MYKIYKILSISFLSFICFLAILTVDAIFENVIVDSQVKAFVENGVFKQELGSFYLYEVEIEEELRSPSVTFDGNTVNNETSGDIFIYKESKMDVLPYSAEFISYFFGGHAGIVDGGVIIEAMGANSKPEDNIVDYAMNNLFYDRHERDVIGLRVKGSDEEIEKAVEYANSVVGVKYNFTFVFNRKNSFYCTDLISRAFGKEANLDFNLDQDGIATSCNDLVLSNDTFITYFMYYKDGIKHLYYAVNK